MRTATAMLTLLPLLGGACASTSSAVIGGPASLGDVLDDEPFYDPATGEAAGDVRLVSSQPLADFDVPDDGVVDGSVRPIGRSGDLQVGTWRIDDPEMGALECFGFSVAGSGTSATCGEGAGAAEEVVFEVRCDEGEPPEWTVFTTADSVVALRLDVDRELPAVGHDPEGTGLVAVRTTGEVSLITAQTAGGEVRLVGIETECPQTAP